MDDDKTDGVYAVAVPGTPAAEFPVTPDGWTASLTYRDAALKDGPDAALKAVWETAPVGSTAGTKKGMLFIRRESGWVLEVTDEALTDEAITKAERSAG